MSNNRNFVLKKKDRIAGIVFFFISFNVDLKKDKFNSIEIFFKSPKDATGLTSHLRRLSFFFRAQRIHKFGAFE